MELNIDNYITENELIEDDPSKVDPRLMDLLNRYPLLDEIYRNAKLQSIDLYDMTIALIDKDMVIDNKLIDVDFRVETVMIYMILKDDSNVIEKMNDIAVKARDKYGDVSCIYSYRTSDGREEITFVFVGKNNR